MLSAWDSLRYLETEPTARQFLTECYQQAGFEHPERQAYQHCTRFVYIWIQARQYYQAAAQADLLIRPLLLFYGCVQMLKGCMLASDPAYPQSSRMLQHGVTTRKMKKSPYRLLEDEIRPQKEGLFAHAADVWKLSPLAERYKIKQLFASLPEMSGLYGKIVAPTDWLFVQASEKGSLLFFPQEKQGTLSYSLDTFVGYLNRLAPKDVHFQPEGKQVRLQGDAASLREHPLFVMSPNHNMYFWNGAEEDIPLPQWAVHYLLLYQLGMLCRYETEWWGELVLTQSLAEKLLVERFLSLHQDMFPRIIMDLLHKHNTRGL
jgi:hypothetical protein